MFVEAWGNSPGGDYSYYQIVVQGGAAKVRGYDGKFTDLGGASVDFVSATELVISITLAPLGLLQDTISLGFASGFCGVRIIIVTIIRMDGAILTTLGSTLPRGWI